eukprot:305272_1
MYYLLQWMNLTLDDKYTQKLQMKTYVVHYTPLVQRKNHMIKQLNQHNLTYEFISSSEKGTIHIFRQHIDCYKRIVENSDEYTLILEDDVILNKNFSDILKNYLFELPSNYDMFFIGGRKEWCWKIWYAWLIPNKHVFRKDKARYTHGYIVSKQCASKILHYLDIHTEKTPIDHWLNDVIGDLNLIVYWAEPAFVYQGTQSGLLKTGKDYD